MSNWGYWKTTRKNTVLFEYRHTKKALYCPYLFSISPNKHLCHVPCTYSSLNAWSFSQEDITYNRYKWLTVIKLSTSTLRWPIITLQLPTTTCWACCLMRKWLMNSRFVFVFQNLGNYKLHACAGLWKKKRKIKKSEPKLIKSSPFSFF